MKNIVVLSLILLCLSFVIVSGEPEWAPEITENQGYNWIFNTTQASNELKSRYKGDSLIGGISDDQGDIEVRITNFPSEDFDFFNNNSEQVSLIVTIEGDVGLRDLSYYSEYRLLILPITNNGSLFFPQLLNNTYYLEKITNSTIVRSDIYDNIAFLETAYSSGELLFQYSWNTTSGLLITKTISDLNGSFISIQTGKGYVFGIETETAISEVRYHDLLLFPVIIAFSIRKLLWVAREIGSGLNQM